MIVLLENKIFYFLLNFEIIQGLFEVAVAAAKRSGGKFAAEELGAIKRIVGDRAYHNGVGTYIRNAFHKSLNEKEGMMKGPRTKDIFDL